MRYKSIAAAIVAGVALSASAGVTITNVKATPRWPWNGKVDIDYTLTTDKEDETFYVYPVGTDGDRKLSITPITLEGDGAKGQKVGAGTHRMTWDATADDPTFNSSSFTMKIYAFSDAAPYMVVNMSGGTSVDKFETSYLPDVPEGGWTDEYKTTKLVLKLILPGSFLMGAPENADWCKELVKHSTGANPVSACQIGTLHRVVLTKPYYIAVFETTITQCALLKGSSVSYSSLPKQEVCYDDIRGSGIGGGWPDNSQVNYDSYVGIMRVKTGMTFDLPTEAQWEFACGHQAQTKEEVERIAVFGSPSSVGSKQPNERGLYDMQGNVAEWCLDGFGKMAKEDQIDPRGVKTVYRVVKGGCYETYYYITMAAVRESWTSDNRTGSTPSYYEDPRRYTNYNSHRFGFRFVRNLSE